MADLADFVLETVSAPGTATSFSLGGAPEGRVPFALAFTTGSAVFYFADDGTQAEWGIGTFTTGSPNLLSRGVIGNTAGTMAKLDFEGQVNVYNEVPAAYTLRVSASGGFAPPNLTGITLVSSGAVAITASSGANIALAAGGTLSLSATGIATLGGSGVVVNGTSGTPVVIQHNGSEVARFNGASLCVGCATDAPNTPSFTEGFVIRPPAHAGPLVSTYRASGDFCEMGSGSFGNAFVFLSTGSNVGSIAIGTTATAFNTTCDYIVKTNIEMLTGALERLARLPVRRFNWIGHETKPKVDGLIAHEAALIVPEAVTGEKDAVDADGKRILQQLDYSKLMPLALAAIQELAGVVAEQGRLLERLLAREN